MSRQYKAPIDGTQSSIGDSQFNEFHWAKKALIEVRKEQYFNPRASVMGMPKHMGKDIKKYHYIPLLDDQNINDQGIDAAGVVIANGNLYGSSKDIGSIPGKFPVVGENGGRVNRVGFRRKEITAKISKFGFFDEYTQESMDFDTDPELMSHINREMLAGASEITEDMLQIDLINNAGLVKYSGAATSVATVNETTVTYADLLRLSIDLDNNRTPKETTLFSGTRMIDTVTIPGARIMYIGSELQPLFEGMVDLHNERAFLPVQKYAAGSGTILKGEIGTACYFRIVVVPEMMKWEAAGAASTDASYYGDGTNLDVFPMLVIGKDSFTTVGFQTDGKSVKWKIKHAKPGSDISYANDPYGETGFMSIKWWYGFFALRPERLAVQYTSAII